MANRHIDTINPAHVVRIKNTNTPNDWIVKAHLPDSYGFSVGSEIGTPFAGFASDNNVSKFLALYYGASAKVGLITTKVFMGPEPTEFTFELEFHAYYSGQTEVVDPIVMLMLFSIGELHQLEDALRAITETLGWELSSKVSESVAEVSGNRELGRKAQKVSDFIKYMRSPGLSQIKFGNVFTIEKAYISSVEPQFSNILDNEGYPMSATCSVSVQLQEPMSKIKLANRFRRKSLENQITAEVNSRN